MKLIDLLKVIDYGVEFDLLVWPRDEKIGHYTWQHHQDYIEPVRDYLNFTVTGVNATKTGTLQISIKSGRFYKRG